MSEPIECVWKGDAPKGPWQPGWTFWAPYRMHLSKHYLAEVEAVRKPIAVMVPTRGGGATWFCIDSHPTDQPDGAWTVSVDLETLVVGQKPRITVSPSIDCVGLYHGYLTDGVLTADLG